MRNFICILALATFLLSGATLHAGKRLVLVGPENPPSEFTAVNGQIRGFNVDVAREALKRMGYFADIRLVPWNRALAMVHSGEADGIIDVAFTPKRAKFLRYPLTPINEERYYAFQRAGSDIRLHPDLSDAGELRVGLLTGAAYGPRLTRLLEEGVFAHVERTVVPAQNLLKLLNDRMDVIIEQKRHLQKLAEKLGVTDRIKPVLSRRDGKPLLVGVSRTYLAFSRRKASVDLLKNCNMHLEEMRDEGFLEKARQVYE